MTAPRALSLPGHAHPLRRASDEGLSSGKFSCPRTYRQFFALRWQRFIQANFRSPAHAADVFRVHPDTAEKWWHGKNAPGGAIVGLALSDERYAESALIHLRERDHAGAT